MAETSHKDQANNPLQGPADFPRTNLPGSLPALIRERTPQFQRSINQSAVNVSAPFTHHDPGVIAPLPPSSQKDVESSSSSEPKTSSPENAFVMKSAPIVKGRLNPLNVSPVSPPLPEVAATSAKPLPPPRLPSSLTGEPSESHLNQPTTFSQSRVNFSLQAEPLIAEVSTSAVKSAPAIPEDATHSSRRYGQAAGAYRIDTTTGRASDDGRVVMERELLDQARLRITVQHAEGVAQLTANDLEQLKKGSRLLCGDVDGDDGMVKHINCDTLRRGCFFVPANLMDALMSSSKESVTVYMDYESQLSSNDPAASLMVRPYVLFPSSMRVPLWLATSFTKLRESRVSASWDLDLPTRTILWLTKKLEVYKKQYMTVWQSKQAYGTGSRFFLFGAEGTGELTDYPYILCLQFFHDGSEFDGEDQEECPSHPSMGGFSMGSTMNRGASHNKAAVMQQLGAFDEGSLMQAVRANNMEQIRSQVKAKHLKYALRKQHVVDAIETVAYEANDPELMLDLYRATTTEMDLSVLAFLLHSAAKQPIIRPPMPNGDPNIADQVERFLVTYVTHRRNPLSVNAAILMALQTERRYNFDTRRMTTLMISRFHSLHLALLKRLNRHADARNIRLIERILEPVEKPRTVNEVSPLQVAFETSDLDFMSETLVSLYTRLKWQGLEYTSISSSSNPRSVSPLSTLVGFVVLEKMGFAGGFLDPLLMQLAKLWHTTFMTSYSFFNSPRGRWAQHALCESGFVAVYMLTSMFPTLRYIRELQIIFLVFVVGNLVDICLYVHYRYGDLGSINKFSRDPWNALGLWLNVALLGLTSVTIGRQEWDTAKFLEFREASIAGTVPVDHSNAPGDPVHMAFSALALLVWARCLGLAVPLYTSLGPLLNTVAAMIEEIIAFAFPLIIILIAFATTMTSVYRQQMDEFDSFWDALLSLFSAMLGNFDFEIFSDNGVVEGAQDMTYGQSVFGIVILVVFLLVSAILLMNLLIAIITFRYRPDEVEEESQFKQALIMDYYRVQVEYHLTCSPFCLAQLVLQAGQLPGGQRQKPSAVSSGQLGLPPLDGTILPEDTSGRCTGRFELPHLVFLCTLYPIMSFTMTLGFVAYTPLACMQYIMKQNKTVTKFYRQWRVSRRESKKAEQEEAYLRFVEGKNNRKVKPLSEGGAVGSSSGNLAAAPSFGREESSDVAKAPDKGVASKYKKFKDQFAKAVEDGDEGMDVAETVVLFACATVSSCVGLALYLFIGFFVVFLWGTLYVWIAKLFWSLYNTTIYQFMFSYRSYQKDQQARDLREEIEDRRKKLLRNGSDDASSSLDVSRSFLPADAVGSALANVLHKGKGKNKKGSMKRNAVADSSSAHALAGGDEESGAGFAFGGTEEEVPVIEEEPPKKTATRWHLALELVTAMLRQRYMTESDVIRALSRSKFAVNLKEWGISLKPAGRLEQVEDQLNDLEEEDEDDEDDDGTTRLLMNQQREIREKVEDGFAASVTRAAEQNAEVSRMREEVGTLQAELRGLAAMVSSALSERMSGDRHA